MAKTIEQFPCEQVNNHIESISDSKSLGNGKKPFVEPDISPAVDVLEATTFFQAASSGATN